MIQATAGQLAENSDEDLTQKRSNEGPEVAVSTALSPTEDAGEHLHKDALPRAKSGLQHPRVRSEQSHFSSRRSGGVWSLIRGRSGV